MNEMQRILVDTATQIFRDHCPPETINAAEQGEWPAALWGALEESGLTLAAVPEELGGAGAELADALAVLRAAGRAAAPIPLAETLLAGWLLASAGRPVPAGPLTVAPVRSADRVEARRGGGGWTLSGSAGRVQWARGAARIVVLAQSPEGPVIASVDPTACRIDPGQNLAGEPNDTVGFDGVAVPDGEVSPAPEGIDAEALRLRGALTRVVLMAGALERTLEQSVNYANERIQFGRPIGKFQAVQQNLSLLAAEVAAAGAAAEAAVDAAETDQAGVAIAAAKTRVGEAAGVAATIAHQVHGAIGFTHEHSLHHSTRRLWTWREEFGKESEWAAQLGRLATANGGRAVWPVIVGDQTAPALVARRGR
jgi:acyl-CoA dehydrogenase